MVFEAKKAWAPIRTPRTDRQRDGWPPLARGSVQPVMGLVWHSLLLGRGTGPRIAKRSRPRPSAAKSFQKLKTLGDGRTRTQNNHHEARRDGGRTKMSGCGNFGSEIHGAAYDSTRVTGARWGRNDAFIFIRPLLAVFRPQRYPSWAALQFSGKISDCELEQPNANYIE